MKSRPDFLLIFIPFYLYFIAYSIIYYLIQVIESDEEKERQYWLYRRWGRVGSEVGSDSLVEFDIKEEAIEKFKENFEAKTGNLWKNRDSFEKKPGKYVLIDIDYGNDMDGKKKSMKFQKFLVTFALLLMKIIRKCYWNVHAEQPHVLFIQSKALDE